MTQSTHTHAWVFAGQGAQRPGMGRELMAQFPSFRQAFEEASDSTGLDLIALSCDGTEDQLSQTEITQPLMLTFGVAMAQLARNEFGHRPAYAAGHSLGEITALCATGAFSLSDAARLVHERGRDMQACVEGSHVAMAAVLGIAADDLEAICHNVSTHDSIVVCANYNAPGQTVISGHRDAVERAVEAAKAQGARRAILLPVSAAFHSPLMAPMKERFLTLASSIQLDETTVKTYANVDARPYRTAREIPARLTEQLDAPVRWTDEVEAMVDDGVTEFIEFAPVPTLTSMIKRITDRAQTRSIASLQSLQALVS